MGRGLSASAEQLSSIVACVLNQTRAFSTLTTLPPAPDGLSLLGVDDAAALTADALQWVSSSPQDDLPITQPIGDHLLRSKHVFSIAGGGELPMAEFQSWGWEANLIWVTPDHRVLDPAGRLLLDGQGSDPDPLAVIPFPVDARRRQSEAAMMLRNRMMDPVEGILPVRGEDEIVAISPAEVAGRALALFLVATRAESILSGQPLDVQRMRARCPLGWAAMSPQELAFFERRPPQHAGAAAGHSDSANAAAVLIWRYEALAAMQWALGMQFELPWPDERADLTAVTRLMIDLPDEAIVEQARLRSTAELLGAAELHYQALHAIAFAQQSGHDAAGVVDPGIVCERLAVLAWICRLAPGEADWDATVQWVENGCV